jgi:TonB-dependent receptor
MDSEFVEDLDEVVRRLDQSIHLRRIGDANGGQMLDHLVYKYSDEEMASLKRLDPFGPEFLESQMNLFRRVVGKNHDIMDEGLDTFGDDISQALPFYMTPREAGYWTVIYGYVLQTLDLPKGARVLEVGFGLLAIAAVLAVPAVASAQNDTGGAAAAPAPADDTVVVVTGYRASLQTSLAAKKKSDVMLDAISSDDIASFPEANLAESLQRIPGISIDRDNGEGRQISVRGLGGDFTRVRINTMEALSTSGSNDSGTGPNRSRAFDFNAFASELFNSAQVRKSQDAATDEGSLGATVDLATGHPFDYKGQKFAINVEEAYYENGKHWNPRVSGLFSTRWAGGKLGFLFSGAYQGRDTSISNYARQNGQADYLYRGANLAGNEYPQRGGFSAPSGTIFNQISLTAAGACPAGPSGSVVTVNGVVASGTQPIGSVCTATLGGNPVNYAITNQQMINAFTGSDPTAYAALYPAGFATSGRFDDSVVRIPALITLNDTELHSDRVGLTSSFQVQWSNNTRLTMDWLYSRFRSESQNLQLQSVGLNRDNTTTTLNTITASAAAWQKRAQYPGICQATNETPFAFGQDCGQTLYGTTPVFAGNLQTSVIVPGVASSTTANTWSVNPFNLDPYDYYNQSTAPGYNPADLTGLNGRTAMIGRMATKVLDAHVTNGTADYLKLANVDWRSGNDASFYTTTFSQFSTNLDHRFSDTFKVNVLAGVSNSTNVNEGFLIEFNAMDVAGPLIYDERGRFDTMPIVNPGFDVADPKNWGIVKGFSGMRHFIRTTKSNFSQIRADFDWAKSDHNSFKFGASRKQFYFYTDQYERQTDTLNPTEKEVGGYKSGGVALTELGSVVQFGQGLDMSPGTPTSFFAPSLEKFSNVFGYDCNCINKYGDWRLTNKRSNAATYDVTETDTGAYVQWNYNYTVFGKDVNGNLGVRQVKTAIAANGRTSAGSPIQETNEYNDTLPSFNMNIHALDNLYVRLAASKAMARPTLANLSPAISAISVPTVGGATTGGTLTVGNTQLKPFRSKNYDVSVEWYFAKDSLLSFAAFDKEIASFPQTILFDGKLSDFLDADSIAAVKSQITDTNALTYINNGSPFTARQIRDAPGGSLWGWELNYQQPFTFLPGFWKDFGAQLNATHIDSKLTYILDPGARSNGVQTKPQTFATGPWLNASPDALNMTLYYQTKKFEGRVSVSKREGYYTTYPIATGTCNPGLLDPTNTTTPAAAQATSAICTGPLVNDFSGSQGTTNVDAKFNYNITEHLQISLEGLNLTNQTSNRYAYPLTAQPVVTLYSSTGRQITVGVRYKY